MKCYKVVSPELESAFGQGKNALQYKIGKYIRAAQLARKWGYHLLTFSTLSTARNFALMNFSDSSETRIFEAVGKGRIVPLPGKHFSGPDDFSWAKIPQYLISWPPDTLMFKKVKLLKEVNDEML